MKAIHFSARVFLNQPKESQITKFLWVAPVMRMCFDLLQKFFVCCTQDDIFTVSFLLIHKTSSFLPSFYRRREPTTRR
nr:MAG TPA: hypothetical protein [Caudoviricetes sp.]